MVFRATLLLVLLVAAVAAQVYTRPEAEVTAAAPAVEIAEEAAPAAEEPAAEAAPAAEELSVEEPAAEAAVDETAEEPAPEEAAEVAAEEAAAEEVVEETAVEEQPSSAQPEPAHGPPLPAYGRSHEPTEPACSLNTTKPWCLEDSEYPAYKIAQAIGYHHYSFLALYQDVVANTSSSVDRLQELEEETYLCSSQTSYVQPLRARNTDGKWRVIVNGVKVHYDTFTQTVRLEECLAAGKPCPLVPECYESSCLQQAVYHRLLIFDAYDYYQPFAMETFKLPSACACSLGAYEITH